ncbi:hypothetical protein BFR04_06655 [Gaetbulibacter sp. 4G1]|nr:hypothetical protein [Gaetbulibacter sp. 4G1]PIA79195.1 hypothetical protein BFR04_06655 [Gaetbulibacter sp. 4G1]
MKIKILFLLIFISTVSHGQYFPKKQMVDSIITSNKLFNEVSVEGGSYIWLNSYILRKSAQNYFADKNSKLGNKGASFVFTSPKDKASSFAINAGLIVGFNKVIIIDKEVKYIKKAILPFLQYDRNTLIDSEQSNLLTGLSAIYNMAEYYKISNKSKFNISLKGGVTYRKDYENDVEALQSSFIFSPHFAELNDKDELIGTWFGAKSPFDIGVNLGFEYDYRFNNDIKALNGNLFRTFSNMSAQLKASSFTMSFGWQYRYLLANSTDFGKDSFSLITFKTEYKPKIRGNKNILDSIEPTIGIIHENGENPTNGFNDQAYWALVLELKI